MTDIITGQYWRHKKRGGLYEVVHANASIQVSSLGDDELMYHLEDDNWIAYRPVDGHALYFRREDEFVDGRFELVKEAE
jgi:hypothetical protein